MNWKKLVSLLFHVLLDSRSSFIIHVTPTTIRWSCETFVKVCRPYFLCFCVCFSFLNDFSWNCFSYLNQRTAPTKQNPTLRQTSNPASFAEQKTPKCNRTLVGQFHKCRENEASAAQRKVLGRVPGDENKIWSPQHSSILLLRGTHNKLSSSKHHYAIGTSGPVRKAGGRLVAITLPRR